ncbi:hypothetical protein [Jiangella endophytica]|uniref:hypothetical protein n=1 Tax=Jiangella endophytica TaxID=1623398 RepID=UPI0018E589B2|nr:hypothetical protein [Jiangella endophytica]
MASPPTDDFWGGSRSVIRVDGERFTADAVKGLIGFSHLEVVFRFHLTDPADLILGARRPRDNPDWPEVGTFGHRNMRRLNWSGAGPLEEPDHQVAARQAMAVEDVQELNDHVGGLAAALESATDHEKADLYQELLLSLTYEPLAHQLRAELVPGVRLSGRVRGGELSIFPPQAVLNL